MNDKNWAKITVRYSNIDRQRTIFVVNAMLRDIFWLDFGLVMVDVHSKTTSLPNRRPLRTMPKHYLFFTVKRLFMRRSKRITNKNALRFYANCVIHRKYTHQLDYIVPIERVINWSSSSSNARNEPPACDTYILTDRIWPSKVCLKLQHLTRFELLTPRQFLRS